MRTLMGLINLSNEHDYLEELTYFRNGASVPFAGRYRLIDFSLSNIVNSCVDEVAIFVNQKYRSLLDHLENGDNFGLDDRKSRLFVLPPDWHDPSDYSRGELRHFHNNRDFFLRSNATDVIISGSQFIANTDFKDAYKHHIESDADITLISEHINELEEMHQPLLRVHHEGTKVTYINHDNDHHHVFTGTYIIKKEKLFEVMDFCIQNYKENFFFNGILERIDALNISFYDIDEETMYINSLKSFYINNLRILDPERYKAIFMKENRIKTKISNQPPTKYSGDCTVHNSTVANGCEIEGHVENSILYRGVCVERGVTIKNSIIMTNCHIKKGAVLENVILDKDVIVNSNQKLIGSCDKPFVVAKRQTI
ncbi:glucose-1-phosphate adenylyltransferase subunit GlgD [Macrococcus armenti]|uniref:glucose-1-phosphate adenylyltransferase subunit GlgD n=1 Tax=Macrococcus armenti TaxID=2875764 RepID=UPI001CCCF95B|nr:glucose-1-phosphate adenylyltransferase subunit GlgD [Macrococcus armenti]UBH16241.1 glucose-1-phosphate adenylyltransferase subunit GlgD [Macrococcus armenti]UBH18599.1 glucose-1-phosphate adenylyltransferase subunit GlgD [Macrococcus armenti]UBH20869.1 glucose-1-phosphate adenylyltransferase subunit GlgD [Macrococcus armenti]